MAQESNNPLIEESKRKSKTFLLTPQWSEWKRWNSILQKNYRYPILLSIIPSNMETQMNSRG